MAAKECGVITKSSLMLGLGETDEEVIDTMLDLKDAGKRPPATPLTADAALSEACLLGCSVPAIMSCSMFFMLSLVEFELSSQQRSIGSWIQLWLCVVSCLGEGCRWGRPLLHCP